MTRVKVDRRKSKQVAKVLTEADKMRLEARIQQKKRIISHALKIPPAINQFHSVLGDDEKNSLFDILRKYMPETKEERRERIEQYEANGNQHTGPKPILLKFGMNHVTDLIKRKKAKLVVIAADVEPIEVVLYVPSLCKKYDVPYCIVPSKEEIGAMVRMSRTAAICINEWHAEDDLKMNELLSSINSQFIDRYDQIMNTWGGGVIPSNKTSNESESVQVSDQE